MPTYERETRIPVTFDRVWEFHSRVTGLTALTPGFAGLEVEEIRTPSSVHDGDREAVETVELVVGTEIDASVRPFDVGSRTGWTSVIVDRSESADAAHFCDEMRAGPMRYWRHTHTFFRDGDGTLLRDRVEYRLPGGRLGAAVAPLAVLGFAPFFIHRHRRTERLLTDGERTSGQITTDTGAGEG